MVIEYSPIGIIHSPFNDPAGMPIQPTAATGIAGTVEVFEQFRDGLKDLDGFTYIFLLYHLHRASGFALQVVPFLDIEERGLFATRAPRRPNALGLSIVRLCQVDGTILHLENVDILDGTPLLDIKPYVPRFDFFPDARSGWLQEAGAHVLNARSDARFNQ